MKNKIWLSLLSFAFLSSSCYITTQVMHNPIYPESNDSVTYSITAWSNKGIKEIKLFESVHSINSSGIITAGTESLLKTWTIANSPASVTVEYTRSPGYNANKLVEYRVWVKSSRNTTRNHSVTFAIRPYPVSNQPAPIYAQGDVDDVFDVVFIPDADITNMNNFRNNCWEMIINSIYREPSMKSFCRQFNFYINPLTGRATDYDRISTDGYHQLPTNNGNLSFADVKVLMHQNNLRDYAMTSNNVFSTEMDRPETFIHEGGHALFGLADEYPGGAHWQAEILPNNWETLQGARNDAPGRGKTAADAVEIGTTGWYKLCNNDCPMISGIRLLFDYDTPCSGRVVYEILRNALH